MTSTVWTDGEEIRRLGLDRVVTALLACTIFAGGFVFMEPAPYEFLFAILFLAVLANRPRFPRTLSIPLLLLTVWLTGGALALAANGTSVKTGTYLAISAYLGLTTIIFAALCAQHPMRAALTIRHAYIAAAMVTATAGIAGALGLFPGADMFAQFGRAKGFFKDPNVFSPFLIFPVLLLLQDIIVAPRRRFVSSALLLMLLTTAILLSFSRASWGHLLVSAAMVAGLMFVTSNSNLLRIRIIGGGLLGICVAGAIVAALLAVPGIGEILVSRAELFQDYDAGVTGRFGAQLRSLPVLLEHPLGFGPYGFGDRFGQDSHNVYLNGFSSYGWLGGLAYLSMVAATWLIGARCALIATPWQHILIAAFATYCGVSLEGIVIDTDHWRHYFLMAGMVWGLSAATLEHRARG